MKTEITTENVDQMEARLKKRSWLPGHKYGAKCLCKDYLQCKVSVKYVQPEKPKSYKPICVYTPPCGEFPTDTVYKKSYLPVDPDTLRQARGDSAAPTPVRISTGEFTPYTTQRLSYGPIPPGVKPERHRPPKYVKGCGHMTDITTHRHDYTPKPIEKMEPFKCVENVELDNTPFEKKTTHIMSYTPIDLKCIERPTPFRPKQETELLKDPFCRETIYRTSYLPVKVQVIVPKCKPEYEKPSVPFTSKTIYTGSFIPPGKFIEDSQPAEDDKGCYCAYPGECIIENIRKAHDYSDGRCPKNVTYVPNATKSPNPPNATNSPNATDATKWPNATDATNKPNVLNEIKVEEK